MQQFCSDAVWEGYDKGKARTGAKAYKFLALCDVSISSC